MEEQFKFFLARGGRKPRTIRLYIDVFKRLLKVSPSVSISTISSHLLQLKERGRKGSYLNHYVDVIRLWGQCSKSQAHQAYQYFKEEEHIKSILSDEEIEAIIHLPPITVKRLTRWGTPTEYIHDKEGNERWSLFFKIMAFTGMRPGEVAHLKSSENVDFGANVFRLDPSFVKTNDSRLVPIPTPIRNELREYVNKLTTDYLFPSRRGGNYKYNDPVVDSVDWGYQFNQRIKRIGIKRKNLTIYSMRHSFITRFLGQDANLFKVQRIVGHKDIRTTMHYLHLTHKDLQEVMDTKDTLARKYADPLMLLSYFIDKLKDFGFDKDGRFRFAFTQTENGIQLSVQIKD